MCLIAFAWQTSKHHRLTLIGNRDEFHRRPTRPLDWWDDLNQPEILAGRDLEAGGTWLGVTRDGRFAAVTNIRAPGAAKAPLSRGQLPLDYLQGRQTPEAFMQQLATQREQYSGFNLLVGDANALWFLSASTASHASLAPASTACPMPTSTAPGQKPATCAMHSAKRPTPTANTCWACWPTVAAIRMSNCPPPASVSSGSACWLRPLSPATANTAPAPAACCASDKTGGLS